jgi:3-phenylpropionate/trans-cinnamate dioxygenase ferredoxin reductase subunit
MASGDAYVIIGASLAGAKAAETLRGEGFDGSIVLIGEEAQRPYERPPLSKDYLLGKSEIDVAYVHDEGWYAEQKVDLRLGVRATAIDRGRREVVFGDGERVGYDKLLLTTGSVIRRVDTPGADLDGVHYLRRMGDSEQIKAQLSAGRRLVVIGAGWIGLEVAAAARTHGAEVTVVEMAALPLQRVLGDDVARVYAELHRSQGVDLRFGAGVREITGDGGRVSGVTLNDGTTLPADAVVVGVGIRPATELAEAAGLEVDNGIVVDEALRSSDPHVFAAGDVANALNPLLSKRVRVEHWANALNGGEAAGRSMLGQQVTYDRVPYFFSDQYDLGMEYSGYVEPGGYDRVVFRGDPDSYEFVAFWVSGGRVLAGMNANVWDVNEGIQALVRSGRPVDLDRLADPAVPLEELLS